MQIRCKTHENETTTLNRIKKAMFKPEIFDEEKFLGKIVLLFCIGGRVTIEIDETSYTYSVESPD